MTDTDKRKDPEGSKQAVTTIIPSTQIREKLGNIELSITDKRLKEVISARDLDEILSLFKAELNQLIEEVKAKKHNQQLPHNPTDEQRCRFYRDGGYNFALDLAKQVIVKRIKEME